MSEENIRELLSKAKTIAVVGLSNNPSKDSYRVANYLQQQGYKIIPVNPAADTILGEKCLASLRELPQPVDIVDVFRRPGDAISVVEDCEASHNYNIWFQLGTINEEDAAKAREKGLELVTDRCIMVEHQRLLG